MTLTPAQQKEEPPLLADAVEDHHELEVEHYSLTQHPAEDCSKQIVQQGSNKGTTNLEEQGGSKESYYELVHYMASTIVAKLL